MLRGGHLSQRLVHTALPSPSLTHTLDWGWHALHISIPTVAFAARPSSMNETVSFVSSLDAQRFSHTPPVLCCVGHTTQCVCLCHLEKSLDRWSLDVNMRVALSYIPPVFMFNHSTKDLKKASFSDYTSSVVEFNNKYVAS